MKESPLVDMTQSVSHPFSAAIDKTSTRSVPNIIFTLQSGKRKSERCRATIEKDYDNQLDTLLSGVSALETGDDHA